MIGKETNKKTHTGLGSPMEESEKGLKDLKGFAAPQEEQQCELTRPLSTPLNKLQPKTTHGSSCICSRGWPCWTSMGGEALGPVEAQFSSVRECQRRWAGVGGWVAEHLHRSRKRESGIRGFPEGKPEKD